MKHAVPSITKAWNDVSNIIQMTVDSGCKDRNLRQFCLEIPDAFRSSKQAYHSDILSPTFFEDFARPDGRSSGGQHRDKNDAEGRLVDLGNLVVIFHRLERGFVTI